MAEYIEREALLKQFEENEPQNWTNSDSEIQEEIDYACYRGLVETAPTADVVEVVRCKDCAVPHNKWLGCPNLNGLIPPPDFYCAKGERKGAKMDGKGEGE